MTEDMKKRPLRALFMLHIKERYLAAVRKVVQSTYVFQLLKAGLADLGTTPAQLIH